MKTIAAGEFKTHCLSLLDQVRDQGCEITITKRGKPVARLLPVQPANPASIFGFMRGRAEILGDIVSPSVASGAHDEIEREWDELNR